MSDDNSIISTVVIDIENIHRALQINSQNYNWEPLDTTNKRKPRCIISKVSQKMRNTIRNLYDPVVVSIGPCHHGEPSLQAIEKKKWRFLDFILTAGTRKKCLGDYLKEIWDLYPLVRSYYANEVKMESNKFVQMLLLDGCFIVTALCQMGHVLDSRSFILEKDIDSDNPTDTWQKFFIYDLLLVENQVPFIVVKRVHELIAGEENITLPITDDITNFVEQILYGYPKAITKSDRPKNFHHILHLCQMYLRPSQSIDHIYTHLRNDGQSLHSWHRALEYYQAGLEFVKREFDENIPHSLLDISLSHNVINIPCLPMEENFITIFRNLIAFEQMNPQFGNDITTYVIFMSKLICNAEDVNLLVRKGIIEHHFLCDEEVANIFIELSAGVEFDFVSDFYLKNICQVLGQFYESRRKWTKWLWRKFTTINA